MANSRPARVTHSNYPRNNCGEHFSSSPSLVSEVANADVLKFSPQVNASVLANVSECVFSMNVDHRQLPTFAILNF